MSSDTRADIVTQEIDGVLVVEPEQPQQCDFCGRIAELRPYGPNRECICFDCGMQDPETTHRMFNKRCAAAEDYALRLGDDFLLISEKRKGDEE